MRAGSTLPTAAMGESRFGPSKAAVADSTERLIILHGGDCEIGKMPFISYNRLVIFSGVAQW